MSGTVTGLGSASSVMVWFEWGTSTNYGFTMAGSPSYITSAPYIFSARLDGLTPGVTYHYRAKVAGATTVSGPDQVFTPQ